MTSGERAGRIEAVIAADPEREELILLAALSVLWLHPQDGDARLLLQRYFAQGYSAVALRETALQLFLLAGFQASLEAMFQIREVQGVGLAPDPDEQRLADAEFWLERGGELQAKVYRDNVSRLRQNLSDISPELADWTVRIGYGLVLSRPGLIAHWRELIEVAVLAAQGFPRQLHSHLRGALNLGAVREEVELVLTVTAAVVGEEQIRPAWQMWRRIS